MQALAQLAPYDFRNAARRPAVSAASPRFTSTGTTIVGLLCEGGVVLAADTRATAGEIVADKECMKIHYVAESMRCCGAGPSADTRAVTGMCSSMLYLHSLKTGRPPLFQSAAQIMQDHLFRHMGYVSAYLILAGYDYKGAHLCEIGASGSLTDLPFVAQGSGSYAAQSVLDRRYRPGLSPQQAMEIAADAVEAGVLNDMGSGSNINVCLITAGGVEAHESFRRTGTESAGRRE